MIWLIAELSRSTQAVLEVADEARRPSSSSRLAPLGLAPQNLERGEAGGRGGGGSGGGENIGPGTVGQPIDQLLRADDKSADEPSALLSVPTRT